MTPSSQRDRGDLIIPKWAAGVIATIVSVSFLGAFGWAWALNAEVASMRATLTAVQGDVAFIRADLRERERERKRDENELRGAVDLNNRNLANQ